MRLWLAWRDIPVMQRKRFNGGVMPMQAVLLTLRVISHVCVGRPQRHMVAGLRLRMCLVVSMQACFDDEMDPFDPS